MPMEIDRLQQKGKDKGKGKGKENKGKSKGKEDKGKPDGQELFDTKDCWIVRQVEALPAAVNKLLHCRPRQPALQVEWMQAKQSDEFHSP